MKNRFGGRSAFVSRLATCCVACQFATCAFAGSYTWAGGRNQGNGTWWDANNWAGGGTPGAGDQAIFSDAAAPATYSVRIGKHGEGASIGSMRFSGTGWVILADSPTDSLKFDNSGATPTIHMAAGSSAKISLPMVGNAFEMTGTGQLTLAADTTFSTGDVAVTGGGSLLVSGAGNRDFTVTSGSIGGNGGSIRSLNLGPAISTSMARTHALSYTAGPDTQTAAANAALTGSLTIRTVANINGTIDGSPTFRGDTTLGELGSYNASLTTVGNPADSADAATPGASTQLDLTSASSLTIQNRFAINVLGNPGDFAQQGIYSWLVMAVDDVDTLNRDGLRIGTVSFGQPSDFSIFSLDSVSGQDYIGVSYSYSAVPEATTLMLGFVGIAPVLLQRRHRR